MIGCLGHLHWGSIEISASVNNEAFCSSYPSYIPSYGSKKKIKIKNKN